MISVLMFASQVYAIEIPHEAFELENGLEVMLLEDHRLPQVVVDVQDDGGPVLANFKYRLLCHNLKRAMNC